ncbi:hypothetical protein [Lysobacter xanthus]
MIRAAVGSFVAAWVLLGLIVVTGHLAWDNRLLWGPVVLLSASCMAALFGAIEDEQHRLPLLLLAATAFCAVLGYSLFYVFVFAFSGR